MCVRNQFYEVSKKQAKNITSKYFYYSTYWQTEQVVTDPGMAIGSDRVSIARRTTTNTMRSVGPALVQYFSREEALTSGITAKIRHFNSYMLRRKSSASRVLQRNPIRIFF